MRGVLCLTQLGLAQSDEDELMVGVEVHLHAIVLLGVTKKDRVLPDFEAPVIEAKDRCLVTHHLDGFHRDVKMFFALWAFIRDHQCGRDLGRTESESDLQGTLLDGTKRCVVAKAEFPE